MYYTDEMREKGIKHILRKQIEIKQLTQKIKYIKNHQYPISLTYYKYKKYENKNYSIYGENDAHWATPNL